MKRTDKQVVDAAWNLLHTFKIKFTNVLDANGRCIPIENATAVKQLDRAMMERKADPVEYIDGKWWFWDETWADLYGPFDTALAANEALRLYVKELNDGSKADNQVRTAGS